VLKKNLSKQLIILLDLKHIQQQWNEGDKTKESWWSTEREEDLKETKRNRELKRFFCICYSKTKIISNLAHLINR
jgi:hypothetical protein